MKNKIQYYVACRRDDEYHWLWTHRHYKKQKSSKHNKVWGILPEGFPTFFRAVGAESASTK